MKRGALLVAVLLVLAGGVALAQSGGGYDLTWSTIAGGGALSAGGGYTLAGTTGQAGAGQVTGGGYTLGGGFWGGGEVSAPAYESYLPLVVR